MSLDPATLAVVACLMSIILAGLLAFSWLQDRRNEALRWWSSGCLLAALASLLFLLSGDDMRSPARILSNTCFAVGYGLSYAAARRFNGRDVTWPWLAIGPAVWLIATLVLDVSFAGRIVTMSLIIGGYGFTTAYELWNGPNRLASQRAAAVVTAINSLYFFARIVTGPGVLPHFGWTQEVNVVWTSMVGLMTLLYAMIFGFLVMSMAKEKTDLEHRRAALIDPLTGVANRRGFLAAAARLLQQSARQDEPVAVLLFDLDHFKTVNDRFGHAVGDETLVEFCAAAERELPLGSLFGRLGGEEFAAVLTGRTALTVVDFADRVRKRFTLTTRLAERGVTATASVGVTVGQPELGIEALLSNADAALYRAKAAGRDRVVAEKAATRRTEASKSQPAALNPALA